MAPDKTTVNFSKCCEQHDIDYYKKIGKFKADKKLFKCMFNKKAYVSSFIYFIGVSIFGHFFYNKKTTLI